jgi:hypothetical protein
MIPMLIAGSTLNAVGSLVQGQQADALGRRNQEALNQQAEAVRGSTYAREGSKRRQGAQAASSQRAALLQGGIDPTSGTAAFGVAQSMRDMEMDALYTRYEGLLQSRSLEDQGRMERYQGKAAKMNGYFSAAASLMMAGYGAYAGGYFAAGQNGYASMVGMST